MVGAWSWGEGFQGPFCCILRLGWIWGLAGHLKPKEILQIRRINANGAFLIGV